eukprot:6687731-Pyramimonas_sp.AAC.1
MMPTPAQLVPASLTRQGETTGFHPCAAAHSWARASWPPKLELLGVHHLVVKDVLEEVLEMWPPAPVEHGKSKVRAFAALGALRDL